LLGDAPVCGAANVEAGPSGRIPKQTRARANQVSDRMEKFLSGGL
jgi:hypothetical protein